MFAVGATAALMLAATTPALAQDASVDVDVSGDDNAVSTSVTTSGDSVEFNAIAQNIVGSFGDVTQTQTGTADVETGATQAFAEDDSAATADSSAVAGVDQSQGFTFVQFNSALNDF